MAKWWEGMGPGWLSCQTAPQAAEDNPPSWPSSTSQLERRTQLVDLERLTGGGGLRSEKRKCNFNLCKQFNRWRWLHLLPLQINFQEPKNVSQTSLAISRWQLIKKVKQHLSHADLHWQLVKNCASFINEWRLLVVTKGITMRRCQARKKARRHDPPGFAPALLKIDLALEC